MNQITQQEFNVKKNDQISVISFNCTDGDYAIRVRGYGNLSLFKAIDEIKKNQNVGLISVLINSEQWNKMNEFECSNKIKRIHYRDLQKIIGGI